MQQLGLFEQAEINDTTIIKIDRKHNILDENYLKVICSRLDKANIISLDFETTITQVIGIGNEIVGIGLAWIDQDLDTKKNILCSVYIPVGHITNISQLRMDVVLKYLKPVLEKKEKILVFNAGFEYKVSKSYGITLNNLHDVRIDCYAYNEKNFSDNKRERGRTGLMYFANEILKKPREDEKKKKKDVLDAVNRDINTVGKHCRRDCEDTYELYEYLKPEVQYAAPIILLEKKLTPVVADMETRGIRIDLEGVKSLLERKEREQEQYAAKCYEIAGRVFDLASWREVGKVLFDERKLIPVDGRSTDVEVLETLSSQDPICNAILEWREVTKVITTYLRPWIEKNINGRIHASFDQVGTSTGRHSSNDPNLQNVPRPSYLINPETKKPVFNEDGKIVLDPVRDAGLRQLFIASDGMKMLGADYSQIEGRIAAELSQDIALLKAYREGSDIHSMTAKLLDVPRQLAKNCNFAIIYGCSGWKLSQTVLKEGYKMNPKECDKFIADFWKVYKGLHRWRQQYVNDLRKNNCASTRYGRRRVFPDYHRVEEYRQEAMDREAVNFAIQGTAADIMKFAMVDLKEAFTLADNPAYMLLTVHDEIQFEYFPKREEEVKTIVLNRMQDAVVMSIPIEIEMKVGGNNWLDTH